MSDDRWRSWSPYLLSIVRIMIAYVFIQYGTTKLFAFPAAVMPGGGVAPMWSLAWFAGMIELIGGTSLLAGLFTRPVAFILSGEMAVAYFLAHAAQGVLWPVTNQGAPAVFFCFLFLYISSAGPGPWSLDAVLLRPRVGSASP